MSEQEKKSSNKALLITGAVLALAIIGFITNGFGLLNHSTTGNATNVGSIPLSIGLAPVIGNPNASVTIYEFSDFSCPFCGAAAGGNQQVIASLKAGDSSWQPAVPLIMQNYVATGKVKFVFKSFQTHSQGQVAHRVGWCLNDQNLFWKFEPQVFADQEDANNLNKMESIAKNLGANMTQLTACLSSGKYNSLFQEDQNMGLANGVVATPTFFINGQKVEGAQSYSVLKKIIDNDLSK